MMWTVKQLCEKIWEIENRHDLLFTPIKGVKVWPLLRMVIYYQIAEATGTFTKPHTDKDSLLDILKASASLIYAFTRNPLRGNHQKDILIFDHARKIRMDDEYVDIYTKYLLDTLKESDCDVIESLYLGRHLSRPSRNRFYLDVLSIGSFIASIFRRVRFSDAEIAYINRVEKDIFETFHVQIPLVALFRREIAHFRYSTKFYTRLLLKRKPKKIFLVVSYSFYKRPLIFAAKALGIETIELQHGTISPFHLGYNFPGITKELDCFPSTFYTFGKYWNTAAAFPLKPESIKSYGFPYFQEQKKKYENIPRCKNTVLFISQGVIGRRLSHILYESARLMPEHEFVYKLHPGEYDRWKTAYPELVKASLSPNVTVVDNNNKNLYAYFAEAAYVVGVFSTAIYEGLAFGCKTFIADLPGAEYMQDLIKQKIVKKISSGAEFAKCRDVPFDAEFDSSHFFGA